ECAAHANLVARVVDVALEGGADHRAAHHALAQRELAGLARELDIHAREVDAALRADRSVGIAGGDALERRLAGHGKVLEVELAVLRSLGGARGIHGDPHLAAVDARIGIGEAEQSTGVVGLDINHLPSAAAPAQVADQGRVDAETAVDAKAADL